MTTYLFLTMAFKLPQFLGVEGESTTPRAAESRYGN
jgi:hypothetical protein